VETYTPNTLTQLKACSMVWTIKGLPAKGLMFLPGSPLLPPRAQMVAIVFWVVFDAMTVTAGLYARAALPDLATPVMAYPMLAESVLPPGAKGLFYVGMLATIMSTLNTLALVSATTLGRDILWRWRGEAPGEGERRRTRWGLVVTALLSILLAILVPSVVMLWYTIGTVIVPGLLVPLVTSFFPRLTAPPRYAFGAMLFGWLVSLSWLIAGWSGGLGRSDGYPLGVEPMVPGLLVSVGVWLAGLGRKREGIPPTARGCAPLDDRERERCATKV